LLDLPGYNGLPLIVSLTYTMAKRKKDDSIADDDEDEEQVASSNNDDDDSEEDGPIVSSKAGSKRAKPDKAAGASSKQPASKVHCETTLLCLISPGKADLGAPCTRLPVERKS